jgi:hypothetical protein
MGSGLSAGSPASSNGGLRQTASSSKRLLKTQLSLKVSGRHLEGTRCDLEDCDVEDVAAFVEHADVDEEAAPPKAPAFTSAKIVRRDSDRQRGLALYAAAIRKAYVGGAEIAAAIERDGSVEPLLKSLRVDAPAALAEIVDHFGGWSKLPRTADRKRARRLRVLIMGSPGLVYQANSLQMELNALPDADREKLLELRREKMRAQAAEAIEKYVRRRRRRDEPKEERCGERFSVPDVFESRDEYSGLDARTDLAR